MAVCPRCGGRLILDWEWDQMDVMCPRKGCGWGKSRSKTASDSPGYSWFENLASRHQAVFEALMDDMPDYPEEE